MNIINKMLKIYRVKDWYYYLGFVLFGFLFKDFSYIEAMKSLVITSFLIAYAFSLNAFCDLEQKKKYFFFPLILLFFILPFYNYFQILLIFLFFLIVTTYSVKPFEFKSKPIISTLSNGFGFSILFLIGYSHVLIFDFFGILFLFLLFSFQMVAQLIHEEVHSIDDKRRCIITTAVFFGDKNVRMISSFFLLASLFLTFLMYYLRFVNLFFLLTTVFFVSFFLQKFRKQKIDSSLRKEYRNISILIGIIYFVSILIK